MALLPDRSLSGSWILVALDLWEFDVVNFHCRIVFFVGFDTAELLWCYSVVCDMAWGFRFMITSNIYYDCIELYTRFIENVLKTNKNASYRNS